MVNVPNALINQTGWVILAVVSLYILAAYGQALRSKSKGSRSGGLHTVVMRIIAEDWRLFFSGLAMLSAGTILWVFEFMNYGAAVGGLSAWIGPIWAFFTTLVLSVTQVAGITDFHITQALAFAAIVGVAAILLRVSGVMEDD